jgi:hypothetical protein
MEKALDSVVQISELLIGFPRFVLYRVEKIHDRIG